MQQDSTNELTNEAKTMAVRRNNSHYATLIHSFVKVVKQRRTKGGQGPKTTYILDTKASAPPSSAGACILSSSRSKIEGFQEKGKSCHKSERAIFLTSLGQMAEFHECLFCCWEAEVRRDTYFSLLKSGQKYLTPGMSIGC